MAHKNLFPFEVDIRDLVQLLKEQGYASTLISKNSKKHGPTPLYSTSVWARHKTLEELLGMPGVTFHRASQLGLYTFVVKITYKNPESARSGPQFGVINIEMEPDTWEGAELWRYTQALQRKFRGSVINYRQVDGSTLEYVASEFPDATLDSIVDLVCKNATDLSSHIDNEDDFNEAILGLLEEAKNETEFSTPYDDAPLTDSQLA